MSKTRTATSDADRNTAQEIARLMGNTNSHLIQTLTEIRAAGSQDPRFLDDTARYDDIGATPNKDQRTHRMTMDTNPHFYGLSSAYYKAEIDKGRTGRPLSLALVDNIAYMATQPFIMAPFYTDTEATRRDETAAERENRLYLASETSFKLTEGNTATLTLTHSKDRIPANSYKLAAQDFIQSPSFKAQENQDKYFFSAMSKANISGIFDLYGQGAHNLQPGAKPIPFYSGTGRKPEGYVSCITGDEVWIYNSTSRQMVRTHDQDICTYLLSSPEQQGEMRKPAGLVSRKPTLKAFIDEKRIALVVKTYQFDDTQANPAFTTYVGLQNFNDKLTNEYKGQDENGAKKSRANGAFDADDRIAHQLAVNLAVSKLHEKGCLMQPDRSLFVNCSSGQNRAVIGISAIAFYNVINQEVQRIMAQSVEKAEKAAQIANFYRFLNEKPGVGNYSNADLLLDGLRIQAQANSTESVKGRHLSHHLMTSLLPLAFHNAITSEHALSAEIQLRDFKRILDERDYNAIVRASETSLQPSAMQEACLTGEVAGRSRVSAGYGGAGGDSDDGGFDDLAGQPERETPKQFHTNIGKIVAGAVAAVAVCLMAKIVGSGIAIATLAGGIGISTILNKAADKLYLALGSKFCKAFNIKDGKDTGTALQYPLSQQGHDAPSRMGAEGLATVGVRSDDARSKEEQLRRTTWQDKFATKQSPQSSQIHSK